MADSSNILPTYIDPDEKEKNPNKAQQIQDYLDTKFSQVKSAVQPGLDKLSSINDTLNKPRDQFINNTANQLDLSQNSVTPQGDPRFREIARNMMDVALPTPIDALALGGAKVASMAPEAIGKLAQGAKEFNQLGTLGSEVGAIGTSLKDLKKGNQAGDLLEKAVNTGYGKTVPVPSTQDLMADKLREAGLARKAQNEAAAAIAPPKLTLKQRLYGR